jgi:hypothetical protein
MMVLKWWELGTLPMWAEMYTGRLPLWTSLFHSKSLQQTEDFREVSYSSTWVSNKNSCTFGELNLALKAPAMYMLEALFLLISHQKFFTECCSNFQSYCSKHFWHILVLGKIEDQTVAIGLTSSWFPLLDSNQWPPKAQSCNTAEEYMITNSSTNCRMKHRCQESISCLHSTELQINLHRYYGIAASILTLCNLNWVAQPVTYNLQHLWFRRYDICMQSWKSKSEIAMSFGIPEYLQHTLNHGPNDTLKQAFCSPDSQS